jgi:hypothetical protein
VLRRIFGPKIEEVAGGWRTLHSAELRNLYASPNIIRVNKSRRMRRAGHVARMRKMVKYAQTLVGRPEGKRPFGRLKRNGRIILE